MGQTFFISTMGCQMNECDSDRVAQSFIREGLSLADGPDLADIVLINTCTVRAKPEQKAVSLLGRLSRLKARRSKMVLGLMGCMAQQQGQHLMARFPQLDFVMGPREVGRILEILHRVTQEGERVTALDLSSGEYPCLGADGYFLGRVSAHVSIMEGCNNFCTYCIVPYVRGREMSRSPHDILGEVRSLISQGVKDIILLGQNVNSYQWGGETDFPSLLRQVSKVQGLWRLRFTTSHPKDLSGELIHCFQEIGSLCPHIHLPFQAGSNAVLRLMNRRYTRDEYIHLTDRLRDAVPGMAITSDVMVGFPGETQEDFELTLDLMKRVRFDGLFSFAYSDRKGTPAESMKDKIDNPEKSRRLRVLQAIQQKISLEINKTLQGTRTEVLVEGPSKRGTQVSGRTASNKTINFDCNINCIGKLVHVKVTHGLVNSLRGEMIHEA